MKLTQLVIGAMLGALCLTAQTVVHKAPVYDAVKFHVTGVETDTPKDWYGTGECIAKRFIIRGYTSSVEYVLTCVEVTGLPGGEKRLMCDHLHANQDYTAWIYPESVAFALRAKQEKPPYFADYDIISERETTKH